MRKLHPSLLWAATLAGCAGLSVYGSRAQFESYTRAPLLRRASFDLSCPAEQLQSRPVGQQSDGYDSIGVAGCGRRATYVLRGGSWILSAAPR